MIATPALHLTMSEDNYVHAHLYCSLAAGIIVYVIL